MDFLRRQTPSLTVATMVLSLLIASTPIANAVSEDDLNSKLESLEKRIVDLEEQAEINSAENSDLERRLSESLTITGYADVEYIITDKEDSVNRFRIHHFSTFIQKQLNDQWKLFSEIEYEDAPFYETDGTDNELKRAEGKILVEQVYTDYTASEALSVRMGRFLTPAGIWLIHHYPPFVPTQTRPQHIRKIFPQYVDGLQFFGDLRSGESLFSYNLYTGNGEGNSGKTDQNEEKALGARIALLPSSMGDIALGLSALSDTLNDTTGKTALGVDMKIRLGRARIQGEYATAMLDPDDGDSYSSIGYYVQGELDIRQHTIFYRYDFFDPNDNAEDDAVTVHAAGVNYHWSPTVVSKIEANAYDPEAAGTDSYVEWIISSVVFF